MDAPESRILAEKYEVLGVLGQGGTGIVYDAVRIEDQKPVALKVMHDALAGDKQIRGRFQREAAILRRLEGEHVCPIYELGEVPGEEEGTSLLYIALPKIDGESLADVLAAGLIETDRAIDIMLQVLEALKSAHAQGVIHRDLKPANVLLDSARTVGAGSKKAVVVDFGMSKIVTGAGMGTTNLTTHNMVFGTPEYMSPEQAQGEELDARCDVYAAGVMFYEMLTGTLPFIGDSPLSVLTAHLTSELDPPSRRPKAAGRVTPALEAVILHALARNRDERYASAEDLSAAIRQATAAPSELGSVRPELFSSPPEADVFATTVPAVGGAPIDVTAPTLINDRPILLSSAPSSKPSRPPPSNSDGRVQKAGSRESSAATNARVWILAWIVVGLASIAAGVYFALRT